MWLYTLTHFLLEVNTLKYKLKVVDLFKTFKITSGLLDFCIECLHNVYISIDTRILFHKVLYIVITVQLD